MELLRRIMPPHLNSAGSDAEYIDKLPEWQEVLREYERITGKGLVDDTVKTATLSEEAPPQLQVELRRIWHRSKGKSQGPQHGESFREDANGVTHGRTPVFVRGWYFAME